MNATKAREFFSEYYEGSMDAGLRQSFERRLNTDASVQAEYRAFERIMGELGELRNVEVEIPFDLSERIDARLDLHVHEEARNAKPAMFAWWKGLAVAGIGALAIFGAFQSLQDTGNGPFTGGMGPGAAAAVPMKVELVDGEPVLIYRPSSKRTVVIRDAIEGTERERIDLDNRELRSPLRNNSVSAKLMSIDGGDGSMPMLVAVPGTAPEPKRSGQGTIQEFVLALADHYRIPVTLKTSAPERMVVWNFESADAMADATKALLDTRFAIEMRQSGILMIQEH